MTRSYDQLKRAKRAREAARRKPRTPLTRTRMKHSKPSAAEQRRKYGTKAFRDWLHALPCQLCHVEGFTQQAHVGGNDGLSRKKDWTTTTALCGPWPYPVRGWPGDVYPGCHARFDGRSPRPLSPEQKAVAVASALDLQVRWAIHVAREKSR